MTSETICVGKTGGRAVTEVQREQEIFGTWSTLGIQRPLKGTIAENTKCREWMEAWWEGISDTESKAWSAVNGWMTTHFTSLDFSRAPPIGSEEEKVFLSSLLASFIPAKTATFPYHSDFKLPRLTLWLTILGCICSFGLALENWPPLITLIFF